MVSQDHDGVLTYRGRTDDQVKVRGHRVEPGELEALLRAVPGVAAAAVVAVPADGGQDLGDHALAAFLQPGPGARPDAGAAREALARALPAPLVPATFEVVELLPVTAHGKTDRQELRRARRPGTGRRTRRPPRPPAPSPCCARSSPRC
ncbi:hypothetical protein NQP46_31810 [Streptomyces albus]|nr:hypothetical protein NQP46_31810 [Streptomyces albus]